jgi:hypothetical protein
MIPNVGPWAAGHHTTICIRGAGKPFRGFGTVRRFCGPGSDVGIDFALQADEGDGDREGRAPNPGAGSENGMGADTRGGNLKMGVM